jgi:rhamnogalacturonan endolyase
MLLLFSFELHAETAVVLNEDERGYSMSNGLISIRVEKRTGNLTSMTAHGVGLFSPGRGYWSFVGSGSRLGSKITTEVTVNPSENNGERGIVVCRFQHDPETGGIPCNVDIGYALGRGDQGVYAFAIMHHPSSYRAFSLGEARYALKLSPGIFDYMTIDEHRSRLMPTGEDWDRGTPLNLKEARRLTTGRDAGRAEHKYDYSAILSEVPAYGWLSTEKRIGLWLINSSMEYMAGGPTKVELTGHLDVNPGGAPTLLNMWLGSHYGGSSLRVTEGEEWTKVIGPFFIYVNSEGDPEALWKNALAQARTERGKWPYSWLKHHAYPLAEERGRVAGQIVLKDGPSPKAPLHIGLTPLDYNVSFRSGREAVGWQRDAKFYQFWARADGEGRFSIPNVRVGTYALHAFGDGILGEFVNRQ